ncbi:HAD family hydrolase [Galbibacter pacificus]|uniref:phosphoserine phosphatase n=1 Tax=Galbibacter pacificus TaxID=2996052 RepID=A0ABT6FW99_9FLAO|nr:HAD family hydrolase [Galbibacter pacificus]MDG3584049.1 HAD family hydrolase [Galbibacter pacificus]MDG3587515.1 HAD family hydrolase [Galbibacter pacificus]
MKIEIKPLKVYLLGLMVVLGTLLSCQTKTETKTDTETIPVSKPIAAADPLPSWNNGKTKKAIMDYVEEVTNENSERFIPKVDRIATFDNDGTLWSEKPIYFQFFFAIDRVKAMAADHPEWKNKQPFKAVLENDMPTLMKQGEKGLLEIIMATHAGVSTDEFEAIVKDWIATAQHPEKKKPYTDLVYQPMLELLNYLRMNDFKTFIVSGGGIEFMRPWAEEVYGIPKNQVIGSSIQTQYFYNDGKPIIKRLAKIDLIDDKEGKPVGINRYIGRKPVFAGGNSDGDLQMLRWTDANEYKSFKLYVHHTDSIREWSYDRKSPVGTFDKALDEANEKGWTIASMKDDWKVIYPYEVK